MGFRVDGLEFGVWHLETPREALDRALQTIDLDRCLHHGVRLLPFLLRFRLLGLGGGVLGMQIRVSHGWGLKLGV